MTHQCGFSREEQKSLEERGIPYEVLHDLGGGTYNAPKMVIIGDTELKATTAGRFRPIENILYIKPQQDKAEERSTLIHEMFHWKDAQEYIQKHGAIRDQLGYIRALCAKHKKILDRIGVTEENVREISNYANVMYLTRRYDEVYTEYRTERFL